jgi:hypothetical protein
MHPWFIFTSSGGCIRVEADGITQAVAEFKRLKHPKKGEIVGVIRGAASMEYCGRAVATPVFGVICCVVENADAATQQPTGGQ